MPSKAPVIRLCTSWPASCKIEAEHPIDLAAPVLIAYAGKSLAGLDADAVVVDAEVRGVGMRNVDGDERDVGAGDLVAR